MYLYVIATKINPLICGFFFIETINM